MKTKNKRAISLVVLTITIIVLSVLATVVIINLSSTDVIGEASETTKKVERQQVEEIKTVMSVEGNLGRNPAQKVIGNFTLTWNEDKEDVIVKYDTVVIPDEFYYVEGTKDTGLVIEDKDGNQFVWVPVEYTLEAGEVVDDNGLYPSFKAVFKRGNAEETAEGSGIYKMTLDISKDSSKVEPANGYPNEIAEYYAMCKSVQEYHGFYIARFEAGDGDATNGTNGVTRGARTTITPAHKVVSKRGAYVYNYVPWGTSMQNIEPSAGTYKVDRVETVTDEIIAGAVYLSKNMYANSSSVVSTLCYGVQWDAIMNFVSDIDHNITDSESWGNYVRAKGAAKTDSGVIQTTGKNEAWKAKNIYDLAGNVRELTMECFWPWNRWVRGGDIRRYISVPLCFST